MIFPPIEKIIPHAVDVRAKKKLFFISDKSPDISRLRRAATVPNIPRRGKIEIIVTKRV